MFTRRAFIERLAATGGVSLAYEAMRGLDLMAAQRPGTFDLRGEVNGVRVVILGAGIAGLTAAYELGKLGYKCQVLEARNRPGGRAHTIRKGTASEEEGSTQTCAFDEGLYFNPGPMRIAYHHTTTLQYCRELGVPVETFAVSSDAQYLYQSKAPGLTGKRVRLREVRTDLDGYVAELLAKSVSQDALNQSVTKEDAEKLLEYLKSVGALDSELKYKGSSLRGPDDPTAARGPGAKFTPLPLDEILNSRTGYYVSLGFEYQPTMLQVVGGTDRLPQALASRVKEKVTYQAVVKQIRQSGNAVSVVYADKDGREHKAEADYCICTLPLNLLGDVDTDFPEEFKKTAASVPYAAAGKLGLQFKRRFWEEDDQIFGGASKTDQEISQVIYPSYGYLGKKGVLVGYYLQGGAGRTIGERSPAERQALALEQGGKIHPQYATEFENAFSVAWHKVKFSKGSWSATNANARRILTQPERRLYLAGDHLNLNAWMQGAFDSARDVVTALHTRVGSERKTAAAAP